MADVIAVPKANEWTRLKALVLDSVSSPIPHRVYNLGLDEFIAWYSMGMRDPDGYLIEVGQYAQLALDHFNEYAG
ncbi:MAG TPA: hypothetical protein VKB88_26400 [Bryobacteraceae bacterium]|nr:hypothetical protein [Bryobacteraceae bacterium]